MYILSISTWPAEKTQASISQSVHQCILLGRTWKPTYKTSSPGTGSDPWPPPTPASPQPPTVLRQGSSCKFMLLKLWSLVRALVILYFKLKHGVKRWTASIIENMSNDNMKNLPTSRKCQQWFVLFSHVSAVCLKKNRLRIHWFIRLNESVEETDSKSCLTDCAREKRHNNWKTTDNNWRASCPTRQSAFSNWQPGPGEETNLRDKANLVEWLTGVRRTKGLSLKTGIVRKEKTSHCRGQVCLWAAVGWFRWHRNRFKWSKSEWAKFDKWIND